MDRFKDKTVLVTGGTSGIGLATAQRLLQEGAKVIVTGSRESSIAKAREVLGKDVVYVRNDAGKPDDAAALAKAVAAQAPKLHGVFFNAGFGRFAPVEETTAAEFDEHYAVNVRGPLLQTRALLPLLGAGASIVFNTSVANDKGLHGMAVYAGTKGALRTTMKILAAELAPRGIRVNAVSPGPVETSFFERTGMPAEAVAEFGSAVQAQVPLRRFGRPAEVAAIAALLLSDDASFVTGAEYPVDGGFAQL